MYVFMVFLSLSVPVPEARGGDVGIVGGAHPRRIAGSTPVCRLHPIASVGRCVYRAFPPRLCASNPGRQAPNPRVHALDERPVVRHCRVSLGDLPGARDFITFPGYIFGPAGIVRLCVCLAHARRGALRRRLPNHKDVVRIGVAFGGEGREYVGPHGTPTSVEEGSAWCAPVNAVTLSSPALVALRGRVRVLRLLAYVLSASVADLCVWSAAETLPGPQ